MRRELAAIDSIREIAASLPRNAPVSAEQVLQLRRDGVPPDAIARGIGSGRSATEISQRAEACAKAKLPHTVLTEDTPFTQRAHVPASYGRLGQGAVNTVWRVDYRVGASTVPMVFKPEIPGRDVGAAASGAGISREAPNFAGRAMAAYLCSEALGLGQVPTTAVTVLDGQLASVMGFVEGFQPVSEGSARYKLPDELAQRLRKQPQLLQAFARQCGCSAAALEGSVLKLERRTLAPVIDPDDGEPLKDSAGQPVMRTVDLPIRFALPVHSGAFRKEMVRAQWLDSLTRQSDRTAMNMMLVPRESGGFDVRLIDNDAGFGSRLRATDGITDEFSPMRRASLPQRIDRALFESFMKLDAGALATRLAGPLADPQAVNVTREDALELQTLLKDYERRGWVLEDDAQWESAEVAQALGIDHDGAQLKEALRPARLQQQRNAINALAQKAQASSYIAREALEQEALRWERGVLKDSQELATLAALFDLDELRALLDASDTAADRKGGPRQAGAQGKWSGS